MLQFHLKIFGVNNFMFTTLFRGMGRVTSVDIMNSITHNKRMNRFQVIVEERLAVLEYFIEDGKKVIHFTHTEVPDSLNGRGIGTALCSKAISYAQENDYIIVPDCWFVDNYMKRKNITPNL